MITFEEFKRKEYRILIKDLKNHMVKMQSYRATANWQTLDFLNFIEIKHEKELKNLQMKLRMCTPGKLKEGDISTTDILTARSVPISTFIDIPPSRKVLCLFHADKNASLHIYETNYYCFACQASGDTISFIMKQRNIPFKEAVLFLVRK